MTRAIAIIAILAAMLFPAAAATAKEPVVTLACTVSEAGEKNILAYIDKVASWEPEAKLPSEGQLIVIVGYPKPKDALAGERFAARLEPLGVAELGTPGTRLQKYRYLAAYEGPY